MTATVSTTGSATEKSEKSISRSTRRHHRADDDERGRGHLGRHDRRQRRQKHCRQEQSARHQVGQAGAGTLTDARTRLDEHRVRRRRHRAADHRAGAFDDQRGLQTREVAVLVGDPGLAAPGR